MKNRIQFIICISCFALMVQTFYPAYQINLNLVEIIDNSEENTQNAKKKPPLHIHESDYHLLRIVTHVLDKNFFSNHVNVQPQWYQDIWLPPPRI